MDWELPLLLSEEENDLHKRLASYLLIMSLEPIRVLVLGQSPYPNTKDISYLPAAFATKHGSAGTKTLRNVGISFGQRIMNIFAYGDRLFKEGVFLVNVRCSNDQLPVANNYLDMFFDELLVRYIIGCCRWAEAPYVLSVGEDAKRTLSLLRSSMARVRPSTPIDYRSIPDLSTCVTTMRGLIRETRSFRDVQSLAYRRGCHRISVDSNYLLFAYGNYIVDLLIHKHDLRYPTKSTTINWNSDELNRKSFIAKFSELVRAGLDISLVRRISEPLCSSIRAVDMNFEDPRSRGYVLRELMSTGSLTLKCEIFGYADILTDVRRSLMRGYHDNWMYGFGESGYCYTIFNAGIIQTVNRVFSAVAEPRPCRSQFETMSTHLTNKLTREAALEKLCQEHANLQRRYATDPEIERLPKAMANYLFDALELQRSALFLMAKGEQLSNRWSLDAIRQNKATSAGSAPSTDSAINRLLTAGGGFSSLDVSKKSLANESGPHTYSASSSSSSSKGVNLEALLNSDDDDDDNNSEENEDAKTKESTGTTKPNKPNDLTSWLSDLGDSPTSNSSSSKDIPVGVRF